MEFNPTLLIIVKKAIINYAFVANTRDTLVASGPPLCAAGWNTLSSQPGHRLG